MGSDEAHSQKYANNQVDIVSDWVTVAEDGYLTRSPIPGDRRKVNLSLTEQAMPVAAQGQALQQSFFAALFQGVSPEDQATFHHVLDAMAQNLDASLKGANQWNC